MSIRFLPDHAARLARARLALTGLSLGDAFGERFFGPEPVARARIAAREVPPPPWATTDDTEMAAVIVATLAEHGGIDRDALAAGFAARYAARPNRGYGRVAQEILLAVGRGATWRAAASAVLDGQGSMGNGAAMRVAPVGAYYADELEMAAAAARASAEVTHAHREGQAGAIAIAVATATAATTGVRDPAHAPRRLLEAALTYTPEGPTHRGLARALELPAAAPVHEAALTLGNGSDLTSADTVPFVLWCAAHHLGDFTEALWTAVAGLGDRDTTCAMVGGIVAVAVGETGLPPAWLAARERLV